MEIKKLIDNIGINLCPYTVVLYVSLLTLINAEDYYQLLGIQQSASTKEIRQAFKKLAVTMHPDKNLVSTRYLHSL
jgi:DnaJ-domain-containing protein 1